MAQTRDPSLGLGLSKMASRIPAAFQPDPSQGKSCLFRILPHPIRGRGFSRPFRLTRGSGGQDCKGDGRRSCFQVPSHPAGRTPRPAGGAATPDTAPRQWDAQAKHIGQSTDYACRLSRVSPGGCPPSSAGNTDAPGFGSRSASRGDASNPGSAAPRSRGRRRARSSARHAPCPRSSSWPR